MTNRLTLPILLRISGITQIGVGILFIAIIPLSSINLFSFLKEFSIDGQPMVGPFFGALILFMGIISLDAAKNTQQYRTFIYWDALLHLAIGLIQAHAIFVVGGESLIISLCLWGSMIIDPLWGLQALYLLKSNLVKKQAEQGNTQACAN